MESTEDLATPANIDQLQQVRPIWLLEGHEVCTDVHIALTVAQAVLGSRLDRVAEPLAQSSGDALIRELRALGVHEASPQTLAMVALVESAVDRIAMVGAMTHREAWEQLNDDVLSRHCASQR